MGIRLLLPGATRPHQLLHSVCGFHWDNAEAGTIRILTNCDSLPIGRLIRNLTWPRQLTIEIPPGLSTFFTRIIKSTPSSSEEQEARDYFLVRVSLAYVSAFAVLEANQRQIRKLEFQVHYLQQRLLAIENHLVNGAPLQLPATPALIS